MLAVDFCRSSKVVAVNVASRDDVTASDHVTIFDNFGKGCF